MFSGAKSEFLLTGADILFPIVIPYAHPVFSYDCVRSSGIYQYRTLTHCGVGFSVSLAHFPNIMGEPRIQ